jgi:hypothetical protein
MQGGEQRTTPRFRLPPMYTLLRARLARPDADALPHQDDRYPWTGHVYDISLSGMRFELDHALAAGTRVEVRVLLPGRGHHAFRAVGNVVRLHDEADEPGPMRMGMTFDDFADSADQGLLTDYLQASQLQAA